MAKYANSERTEPGGSSSYGSNTRYLTYRLNNPETFSELELVKSYFVELRVLTSLVASVPFKLNGTIVVPTSWAKLIISILDIKMGTMSMNYLCLFPLLKVTEPEKTCFNP